MGQQWLVAAGAVIGARGVERRKLVESCQLVHATRRASIRGSLSETDDWIGHVEKLAKF